MRKAVWIFLLLFTLPLLSFDDPTNANEQEYEPIVGQHGKDVIWVPTDNSLTEAMLEMAGVTAEDFVIDLGSGDGRIVIAAAKLGARALGIEFNPDMVELSRKNAAKEGVSDRATFKEGDIFESDFSQASVITLYLLTNLNLKLRPSLLELKPGTRIVSHSFTMGDWEADQKVFSGGQFAYLWIVPAKVEGLWTWQEGTEPATLTLTQTFQEIEGTLTARGRTYQFKDTELRGDSIRFSWRNQQYSGLVGPDRIRGTIESQNGKTDWVAKRQSVVDSGQ